MRTLTVNSRQRSIDAADHHTLLDVLRARAATLSLLTTHSATLEDVFVSLTGRHLRDQ